MGQTCHDHRNMKHRRKFQRLILYMKTDFLVTELKIVCISTKFYVLLFTKKKCVTTVRGLYFSFALGPVVSQSRPCSGLSSLFPDGRHKASLGTAVERTWAPPTTGTSAPPPSSASPLRSPLTTCPLPRQRPATGELLLRPWVLRSPCSSLVSLRRHDLVSGCLLCFPSN
jgi:hypothetical protein